MTQKTVLDKTAEKQYSLNDLLEIGSFFKDPDNREQFYDDYWTFKKIDTALRLWITTFKPELQNASFEEILEALKQLTPEEQTQTTVPTSLLEQLEKDLDQTIKTTAEAKQKATALKNEFLDKLTQSPISPEKIEVIAGRLSESLSERQEEQTPQEFAKRWEEVVAKTAKENNLSTEEFTFLKSLSSSVLQTVESAGGRTQTDQPQETATLIDELIGRLAQSPIPIEDKEEIAVRLFQDLSDKIKSKGSNLPVLISELDQTSPGAEERPSLEKQIQREFSKVWENVVKETTEREDLSPKQAAFLKTLASSVLQTVESAGGRTQIDQPQETTTLIDEFLDKLTQSPVLSEKKTVIAGSLSKNLSESLEKSDLPVLSYKLEQTPPGAEENLQLKEQVQQRFSEIWKEAVTKTVEENKLSNKEATFLDSLASPVLQIVKPIENKYKNEFLFYQEKIENIKGRQIDSIIRVLSPSFEPEKAKFFSDEFFKLFPDNLARYSSAVPSSQEIEEATLVTLWQMVGSEVRLKPEEIAAISNNLASADLSKITAYKKLSSLPRSDINLLQLKDEDKITVFDRIKLQLLSGGININPESDKLLKSLRFQVQAIEAIYKGLRKQDLEIKINQLLKTGLSEHSPEITELRGVATAYGELLQQAKENGFSKKQIDKWQKQASFPVRLSFSGFGTIIERTGLSGKIQIPLFSKIKSWFLNTSLGKPIKFASEKAAQKSLQGLWTAGREGIKKVAVPIVAKALTVLGFGAKAALIGATNVVGLALLVVPKLIGKIKDSIKGIFSSGTRLLSSMFSGIMGTTDIPEDSDSKWLKWIFIGIFAFIFFFGFFEQNVKSGAFLGEREDENELPGPFPSGSPTFPDIQCGSPRHLGEIVVCQLTQRPSPCNQNPIRRSNWPIVDQCFQSPETNFQGKETIRQRLKAMTDRVDCSYHVQCLGFVLAIQSALGQNLDMGFNYAGAWAKPPYHPNYQAVSGPEMGDIVVWAGSPGHIAIFLGAVPDSSSKIVVVEANYDNAGSIAVRARSNLSRGGAPSVFLRYCPAKNCK